MAETSVWIDPTGVQTTLAVEWNARGRGMPPVKYDEEEVPEQPGSRFRAVQHKAGMVVLPLWITGTSEANLWTKIRALVRAMDPKRGEGILRVTTSVGDTREIPCRYDSGLELEESLGSNAGPLVQRCAVSFRAFTPYWRDASDTVSSWMQGAAPGGWFPFDGFPSLSSSEIFSNDIVTNAGDVETWPVWTITGPTGTVVLRNITSGKQLTLVFGIPAGEVVTIDTRPGRKTVTTLSGQNLWPQLSSTSALWSLVSGSNTVRVECGTTSTATLVQLARRHQYLSV